ncbi:MAG: hypothetical protein GY696_15140 [Gammaproteobacteria bacterium]|nr:hypothetical protein [Gammaproteobacteria bacterium]
MPSNVGAPSVGGAPPGANEEGNSVDKCRPVSSNPVAGTPWCVVWTGDNRIFFFNPSTRTSVWERPPELYGRPDVDLLVSKPPEPKKGQFSQTRVNCNNNIDRQLYINKGTRGLFNAVQQ